MLSNIQVIPSAHKKEQHLPLLIYDPDLSFDIGQAPDTILVYRNETLASLSEDKLTFVQTLWNTEVVILKANDLFLEELYFIDLEAALPGALLPPIKDSNPIVFKDKRVTPLIPLNPILLDYFTPEDLMSRIQFQPLGRYSDQVRFTLTLPLTGFQRETDLRGRQSNRKPQSLEYRLYKDYNFDEVNALLDQLPVVEIWPNFQKENWKDYYGFYFDSELGKQAFSVKFPNATYSHKSKQGQGNYQIVQMETFPEYISCFNSDQSLIGLILLQSPPSFSGGDKWSVGVDFNQGFINIYYKYTNSNGIPKPLDLKNLLLKVTRSEDETRIPCLFDYFIPEDFIPKDKPLPLETVLTLKGSNETHSQPLPILDGRIFVPDNQRFEPEESCIKFNLDMSPENQPYVKCFLGQLGLQISALAAINGVSKIEWFVSYPSYWLSSEQFSYQLLWEELLSQWENKTGLSHCNYQQNYPTFRWESVAFAQYFADFEEHNLIYTSCLYLLEENTVIGIWENNQLIYEINFKFGQRDLLNTFLENNLSFIERRLKFDSQRWKNLSRKALSKKLRVWLRLLSEDWLKTERRTLQKEEDFQGLLQLSTIGVAGIYYYIGLLLKELYNKGIYQSNRITPVYVGGKGASVFHWLDSQGKFTKNSEVNRLFSRMLNISSGFPDSKQTTQLSQHLEDEVACGLILNRTKLEVKLGTFEDEIEENLETLAQFLYQFHQTLIYNTDIVSPLKNYVISPQLDENKILWEDIERELRNLTLQEKGENNSYPTPNFILGLKALLIVLGKRWTNLE